MSCRKWELQILRWQEGELDKGIEERVLQHLESCVRCRTLAKQFSEVDSLVSNCGEPALPPFLREKVVSTVSEVIRQDPMRGTFSRFFSFLDFCKPAVAGAILVLGIGLGVVTGWNLAQSMTRNGTGSSYDLLSLAGLGGEENGSSLEFIWSDNGRTGQ